MIICASWGCERTYNEIRNRIEPRAYILDKHCIFPILSYVSCKGPNISGAYTGAKLIFLPCKRCRYVFQGWYPVVLQIQVPSILFFCIHGLDFQDRFIIC